MATLSTPPWGGEGFRRRQKIPTIRIGIGGDGFRSWALNTRQIAVVTRTFILSRRLLALESQAFVATTPPRLAGESPCPRHPPGRRCPSSQETPSRKDDYGGNLPRNNGASVVARQCRPVPVDRTNV